MFMSMARSMLGEWGNIVLEFYLEHQLVINTIVIAYGLTMIILRRRKKNKE